MSFKNIPPAFVLTLRQFGGLNHVILRLRDFLFIILVLDISVILEGESFNFLLMYTGIS